MLAKQTPGFSGADIENLVNEAAILAARRNRKAITMGELQESIEKVIAGPERKSRLISEEEKRVIAYHEAGHALVMRMLPNCDPVFKVSIIFPRHGAGLPCTCLKTIDICSARSKFMDDLSGLLGGRASEDLVFGDITTGAANDLERATDLARAMVHALWHERQAGSAHLRAREELVFWARRFPNSATIAKRSPKRSTTRSSASSARPTTAPERSSRTIATN